MNKKLISLAAAAMLSLSITSTALASPGTVERYVNFRSAPSTSSTVYKSLSPGTSVDVIEKVNSYWLKISVGGQIGYVSPSYVTYSATSTSPTAPSSGTTTASALASRIIERAKSLQGITHYEYGVNQAPSLMDCSAFTKYVYGKEGISLRWGTRYQKDAGTYVSKSNLKPGDLVFFRVGSSTSIGHVGIYMGNGQMIHNSPSADGVQIISITSGYWEDRYVTARRVL